MPLFEKRRPAYELSHYLILGLSLSVVWVAMSGGVPPHLETTALVISLIGMLAFLGLPRATVVERLRLPVAAPHAGFWPSRQVENRLDRIMSERSEGADSVETAAEGDSQRQLEATPIVEVLDSIAPVARIDQARADVRNRPMPMREFADFETLTVCAGPAS